jgi:hypothetical protein
MSENEVLKKTKEFVIDETKISVEALMAEYGMERSDWQSGRLSGSTIDKIPPSGSKRKQRRSAYFYWASGPGKWILFYDGPLNSIVYSMIKKGYIIEVEI